MSDSSFPPEASFPPEGWVLRDEAARMLGVRPPTLTNFEWQRRLPGARCVMRPDAGRCNIYPLAEIEQIRQERAAARAEREAAEAARAARAAAPPAEVPEGFVDRDGACRILSITPRALKHWVTDGKVRFGTTVPSRVGGRCSVYPVEALTKLREELFSRDNLFKGAAGSFETPPGWARRREACQMLGIDRPTWERWARDGLLPAGQRFDGGPTLYRIEDLKKSLERAGLLVPPYPDPHQPGAYRVALGGGNVRNAGGREAVIDADSLPLLDGAVLSWESVNHGQATFVGLCRPEKPKGEALRRVLMRVTDEGLQVGHVNDDPLDCRRANLIVRTIKQRTRGARKMKSVRGQPCSSRFKGVCLEKRTGKWRATIVVDGRTVRLGRFRDELAAAEAYDEAAREFFGAYGYLNFPNGVDARLARESQKAAPRAAA